LLVHKTFNASIPRHHIPTDDWEFVYGSKQSPEGIAEEEEERGNWVHKVTKDDIGGPTSQLQFTITGLVFPCLQRLYI
jgi:DNA-directed RNA polymerase I subunit RPA43